MKKHQLVEAIRGQADRGSLLSCNHPLAAIPPNRRGSLTVRDLLLLTTLVGGVRKPGPRIRAEIGWSKSESLFQNVMRRLLRERLIDGVRGGGQRPHVYWLGDRGRDVVQGSMEFLRAMVEKADSAGANGNGETPVTRGLKPLAVPGTRDGQLLAPSVEEMRRVLSEPDVLPQFRLLCEALQAWRYNVADLVAIKLRDANLETGHLQIPMQKADGKTAIQMTDKLGAAVRRAVESRKAGPLFEAPRGRAWSRGQFSRDRRSQKPTRQCELLLKALDCGVLQFKEIAALRLSDVRVEEARIWTGEGLERAPMRVNGAFLTVLKDAIEFALDCPLFRTAHAGRWSRGNISETFRYHGRNAGIPDNVQFPGSAKLRIPLIAMTADSATVPAAAPEFTDYFPPKAWRRAFKCSERNWPRIKETLPYRDSPISGAKLVAFDLAALRERGISPPSNGG